MRYYVPTTFTDSFLEYLTIINSSNEDNKITEVYGSLPFSPIGSARPSVNLPKVTIEDIASHIDKLNRLGVTFSYLLNTPFDSVDYQNQKVATNFIDNMVEILGCNNSVTIGSKKLFEYIKKRFKIKTIISIVLDIKKEENIKYFFDNGAENIVLSTTQNRNFKFLKNCVERHKDKIILMANESCLFNCKDRLNHYIFSSKHSSGKSDLQFFKDNYMSSCTFSKLTNLVELIKSSWIRPEDISFYEDIGITSIKLADRTKSEKWLINCFNSYISKKSPDNFFDLLAITPHNIIENNKTIPLPSIYIDNNKLTNFINYFYMNNIDCLKLQCNNCYYCNKFAEEAISVDNSELKTYLQFLSQ